MKKTNVYLRVICKSQQIVNENIKKDCESRTEQSLKNNSGCIVFCTDYGENWGKVLK